MPILVTTYVRLARAGARRGGAPSRLCRRRPRSRRGRCPARRRGRWRGRPRPRPPDRTRLPRAPRCPGKARIPRIPVFPSGRFLTRGDLYHGRRPCHGFAHPGPLAARPVPLLETSDPRSLAARSLLRPHQGRPGECRSWSGAYPRSRPRQSRGAALRRGHAAGWPSSWWRCEARTSWACATCYDGGTAWVGNVAETMARVSMREFGGQPLIVGEVRSGTYAVHVPPRARARIHGADGIPRLVVGPHRVELLEGERAVVVLGAVQIRAAGRAVRGAGAALQGDGGSARRGSRCWAPSTPRPSR